MKEELAKKIGIVKLSLFPYDIMVVFGGVSIDKLKKKLDYFGQNLTDEAENYLKQSGLAHTIKMPNRAVLIYFKGNPTQGIIAHEVFHAVWMILATMGVDPSIESEEVYAYMLEYVVNEVNKLNPFNQKR